MSSLMTVKELRERLGMKRAVFFKHQARGKFRDLVARHPVGHRKYSRVLVDRRYPLVERGV
mgnify:CR=1 FL=1